MKKNRYHNMSEEKKQKLKEYQKNYHEAKKKQKKQEAIHFRENSIIKSAFHKNKKPININTVHIQRIALSDKNSLSKDSFKYFIGYTSEGNAFSSPLCIKLPQMNAYARYFDKNNKFMNHLVKDEKTLKKYLKICNKIKSFIKNKLSSEPVYNDKYIKITIKIFNSRVYTNFQHNNIPKDNEYCACLSVILLDSIFLNLNKEYYLQIFLEEFKSAIKARKRVYTINEEL